MMKNEKEIPEEWLSFFKSLASRILPEEYKMCKFIQKEEEYCVFCFLTSRNDSYNDCNFANFSDCIFVTFNGHYNFDEKPQDPQFFDLTYDFLKDVLIKTIIVNVIEKNEGEKLLINL